MIDLIGFWSSVTVLTVLILMWPVAGLVWAIDKWVKRITGGDVQRLIQSRVENFLVMVGVCETYGDQYTHKRLSLPFGIITIAMQFVLLIAMSILFG